MHVLIVKNVVSEGSGTIADYLENENIPYTTVEASMGDVIPDIRSFTHLVIMGGPMAVYEMHRYAYLQNEAILVDHAIKAGKRVLGICLGAQMIAHVLGARVYAGLQKEIGWYEVELTEEGVNDPLLSALAIPGKKAAEVFQWHGDTFDLPVDSLCLASSSLYPNQAFRYQDGVYALQFHIEVTPVIVHDWLVSEREIDFPAITSDSGRIYAAYRERARKFYELFFRKQW
jgi:GMP synthase (glutamine-hydrolysing)